MKTQSTIGWLDSFLNCKDCETHTLCTYHKSLLIADLRRCELKQPKVDSGPWSTEDCSYC